MDQGKLRTVLKTAFGGGETNYFRYIYQLKQFMNKFADPWGFVIKVHGNSIKCHYKYVNGRQAEYKKIEKQTTVPVTNKHNLTVPSSSVDFQFKVNFSFVHGDIEIKKTRSMETISENTEGQLEAYTRLFHKHTNCESKI